MLLIAYLFDEQREQLPDGLLTIVWQCFPGGLFT